MAKKKKKSVKLPNWIERRVDKLERVLSVKPKPPDPKRK
jgi:hypothetical protein